MTFYMVSEITFLYLKQLMVKSYIWVNKDEQEQLISKLKW